MKKKTFHSLLKDLEACRAARDWANYRSVEKVVASCHKGDWLLWLANELEIDNRLCVKTCIECIKTIVPALNDKELEILEEVEKRFAARKQYKRKGKLERLLKNLFVQEGCFSTYRILRTSVYSVNNRSWFYPNVIVLVVDIYAFKCTENIKTLQDLESAKFKHLKRLADICREILGDEIINEVNKRIK